MTNPAKYARLANAWQKFITNGEIDKSLAPEVVNSWLRCKDNLNPLQKAPLDKLEQHRINELLDKYQLLLHVAIPIMEDLYLSIKGSGFSVILTNNEGYILKVIGDPSFLKRSNKVYLSEGVNWHEDVKGTNAIAIALEEQKPVTIFAHEHFFQENHFLTCSAAPIFDANNNLIGILDISGNFEKAHPHNLGLALAAAKAIQNKLVIKNIKTKKDFAVSHHAKYDFDFIIGRSQKILDAIKLAKRAAQSDSIVLLQGESGTGKELFAHAIHNQSLRKENPFIPLNCGAIPETLIESEFFGYEPGAFTGAKAQGQIGKFELANNGTLFLDEISELPIESQTTLLRVLQDHTITRIGGIKPVPIDVRIITATNKNLQEEIQKGKFRLDLFYRINVINIDIPPLRERPEDIDILTHYYLSKLGNKFHHSFVKVSPEVRDIFLHYQWPGNVRELINILERALHLIDEDLILPEHLPQQLKNVQNSKSLLLENVEERLIRSALLETGNNISQAAELLGIGRATLYRKLEKYQVKR
ncbi:MAG: sigma-54-dependent Fis family transcriptional regulator [Peptococcales bacterium]